MFRAIQEAGVKIDIVAGRGIGVVGAMYAAVDGGSQLWDAARGWLAAPVSRFYRWRWMLRAVAVTLGTTLGALMVPLVVLVGAVLAYPVSLIVQMVGFDLGRNLAAGYAQLVEKIFEPTALPVFLPRFVTVSLLVLLVTLAGGTFISSLRARLHRRSIGPLWWHMLGAPLSTSQAVEWFTHGLWRIMQGAARIKRPTSADLGERYAQLLADNVGQPGFRELILLVHDLDGRRDLVSALLAEPYRRPFFLRRLGDESGERHLETIDLAGWGRDRAVDMLSASLGIPVATEPHLMSFPADGVWRGEIHRLCDRPESTARLLEEVAQAGAEQVILVTALPEATGPHTLKSGRRDARGRLGEHLAAVETASIRDALSSRSGYFQAVFQIRPTHNPIGPLDFRGCYDEQSDRLHTLDELVTCGYEDGFLQFVDSVVGASGEWIHSASSINSERSRRDARTASSDDI